MKSSTWMRDVYKRFIMIEKWFVKKKKISVKGHDKCFKRGIRKRKKNDSRNEKRNEHGIQIWNNRKIVKKSKKKKIGYV